MGTEDLENRISIARRFLQLCDKKRLRHTEESAALYLGVRSEVLKRSALLQYARCLKQMPRSQLSPLDKMTMGLVREAARERRHQARPLLKAEMDEIIASRQDWKERVVLRLVWITASRWGNCPMDNRESPHPEGRVGDSRLLGGPRDVPTEPGQGLQVHTHQGRGRPMFGSSPRGPPEEVAFDYTNNNERRSAVTTLECDGALNKARRWPPRSRDRGRKRMGPAPCATPFETCGPIRRDVGHHALPWYFRGTANRDFHPGGADVNEPWRLAEVPSGQSDAYTITRRFRGTRLASTAGKADLPLQQVRVPVFNLPSVMAQMSPQTLTRFNELVHVVCNPPNRSRESARRIPVSDGKLLLEASIIEPADARPTTGWVVPFSVAEEKTTGKRRRWIAWPWEKNEEDLYEASLPLEHISVYLPAVHRSTASCLDLRASFF